MLTMSFTKKELRFWSNWTYIILAFSTSQFGISSSFHQFVTNPTQEEMASVNTTAKKIEPGLGETELFYSMLISSVNFASLIGGVISGLLMRSVPYWHLLLIALVSHTVGFVLYCLSYQGWLMMIARLLSGYFVGAIVTLSFGYCTVSSEAYVKVRSDLGKQTDEKSSFRIRNYLFSALSLSHGVGVVISAGVTIIFAQFESVDQFRAIGWFNAAYGAALICLQLIMFHGEFKCKKGYQCLQVCPDKREISSNCLGLLSQFIVLSLLVMSMIEKVRFGFLLTLFNPIASDSFGVDERGATYLILALSIFQIFGSILAVILQRLNISSQAITLLAIIATMLGYLIVTDWQTIPYDPCTEFSPFHHPDITHQSNSSVQLSSLHNIVSQEVHRAIQKHNSSKTSHTEMSINLLTDININTDLGAGSFSHYQTDYGTNLNCRRAETCACNQLPWKCLKLLMDKDKIVPLDYNAKTNQEFFYCTYSTNQKLTVTFCILLSDERQEIEPSPISNSNFLDTPTTLNPENTDRDISLKKMNGTAEIDSINILPEGIRQVARNNCIQANVSGHHCHWIPDSDIFKKECEDCQPICRSVHQTLTFPQYIIGYGFLLVSSSLQMITIASLLMNQSPEPIQGIVMGLLTAADSIARTLAPLFLDAAYEGLQKRTFLVTILLALIHIPFIIEIIVLYPKLGPTKQADTEKDKYQYTKLESVD